jgi:riboflavin kinase
MPFRFKYMKLRGRVVSGVGEGSRFLALKEYTLQCERNIGFTPFPGTLNIRIKTEDVRKFLTLKKQDGILLLGFKKNRKVFGSVKCFRAVLLKREVAVVVPEKSSSKDVMEIISDKNLREELNLSDDDSVEVEVFADVRD